MGRVGELVKMLELLNSCRIEIVSINRWYHKATRGVGEEVQSSAEVYD